MSKLGCVGSCLVASIFVFAIACGMNEASARGFGGHGGGGGGGASEPAGVISAAAVSAEWAGAACAAEWAVLTAASQFARLQWGGRSQPFARPGNFTRPEAWVHEISPGWVQAVR